MLFMLQRPKETNMNGNMSSEQNVWTVDVSAFSMRTHKCNFLELKNSRGDETFGRASCSQMDTCNGRVKVNSRPAEHPSPITFFCLYYLFQYFSIRRKSDIMSYSLLINFVFLLLLFSLDYANVYTTYARTNYTNFVLCLLIKMIWECCVVDVVCSLCATRRFSRCRWEFDRYTLSRFLTT